MKNEIRLIDANALEADCNIFNAWDAQIVKAWLADQPTVDAVEVVHAKWHDVYLITPWVATGICSHCNLKSYINPDFPWSNYCPSCGAKMDGGEL